jgi:RNA polymerase sigma factor (sigma-70 family)
VIPVPPTLDADQARARLVAALGVVRDGDRDALRLVYQMTSAKLFGICLRICGNRSSAEDVLQTVYLRVWDKAGQFDGERASPVTWLATIARNAAIDWQRSVAGRPVAAAPLTDAVAETVADEAPRADALMIDADNAERLHHCLETLEARTNACIRSAFFEGLTYADIAAREEVPLGTMKSWIRRGLLRLKDCLGDG